MSKIAWITGDSSGIGRALALKMAKEGWTVAASARRMEQLDSLAAEGPKDAIKSYPLDVTNEEGNAATVAAIEKDLGPIDCAVLAAGNHIEQSLDSFKTEDFRSLMDLNYHGGVNGIAAVLPGFKARKSGHLVVVASVAGYRGLPRAPAYCASKAALIALTESLRFELEPLGIKTQVVNPGFVRTPLTDKNTFEMPFLMEVEDAARDMYLGMRGDGFEVTFPKAFAFIMKRLRCMPDWLFFKMVGKGTGIGQ